MACYPKAHCELETTSRVLDLVHEGYDLAIRVGELDDAGLAARALGELRYGLFASPHYVKQRGLPRDVAGLRQQDLLMFSGGAQRSVWRLMNGERSVRIDGPSRLRSNNSFAIRHAIMRGLGVGQLPLILAAADVAAHRIVPVLPGWARAPVPVHAVFPSNRYVTPKVRAFIDLAVAQFPAQSQ